MGFNMVTDWHKLFLLQDCCCSSLLHTTSLKQVTTDQHKSSKITKRMQHRQPVPVNQACSVHQGGMTLDSHTSRAQQYTKAIVAHQSKPAVQVREKSDKFQQRSLDGFFKAGLKSCTEEACADRLEQQPEPADMHMPDVMAMEVEMEVSQSAMFAFGMLNFIC